MSVPAPGGSGNTEEERKGLSKFVRRASKVFRRRSSARGSISGPVDVTQTASGTAPTESGAPQVSSPPPIAEAAAEEQPTPPAPAPVTTQQTTEPKTAKPENARLAQTAAASGTIQEERARALFAKYGLTLEPGEWTTPIKPDAERVEKKIRMRVHRQCHRCQTTFGPDRICSKCKHNRCKKCPRFPTKRAKESKGKGVATIEETGPSIKTLTITSRATGKQLSYKPVRQRVRWTCHVCFQTFKDRSRQCEGCEHDRCDECPRQPPKREKRKLDPDAVKTLEERMKTVDISPPGASAA
ncbi:MAG: hypothetical protein Q9181_005757 [Wetmoreana brouardii]